MGFYGSEPFNTAKAYYHSGPDHTGHFTVIVQGEVRNYTSGIELKRDEKFVGGLKVNVMGWTGPLGAGTRPYVVHGTFEGEFRPEIVVAGSNKTEPVKVLPVPAEELEQHLLEIHNATIGQPVSANS